MNVEIVKRAAEIISTALTTVICCLFVVALASDKNRWVFFLVAIGVNLVSSLVAHHLWCQVEFRKREFRDWLKDLLLAVLIVLALYAIDVIIGVIAHPDLSFGEAALRNIGLAATIFISPIILIAAICTLRSFFERLFR